jgi:hypothetical protein
VVYLRVGVSLYVQFGGLSRTGRKPGYTRRKLSMLVSTNKCGFSEKDLLSIIEEYGTRQQE